MLILFGGLAEPRGNIAKRRFYRKKKSYFRLPAIMHVNNHIAEITPMLAFLPIAEGRELPIIESQHAI
jgi:hypothetical protein